MLSSADSVTAPITGIFTEVTSQAFLWFLHSLSESLQIKQPLPHHLPSIYLLPSSDQAVRLISFKSITDFKKKSAFFGDQTRMPERS